MTPENEAFFDSHLYEPAYTSAVMDGEVFPSPFAFPVYLDRLHGKDYGEQNFSLWMEKRSGLFPTGCISPFATASSPFSALRKCQPAEKKPIL